MSKLKHQNPRNRPRKRRKDARPMWWHAFSQKLDLPGRLAERLEGRWQRWWVPAVLLAFPVLLLVLAFVVNALR